MKLGIISNTRGKKLVEGETTEINPCGVRLPGQDEDFHVAVLDPDSSEIDYFPGDEL